MPLLSAVWTSEHEVPRFSLNVSQHVPEERNRQDLCYEKLKIHEATWIQALFSRCSIRILLTLLIVLHRFRLRKHGKSVLKLYPFYVMEYFH